MRSYHHHNKLYEAIHSDFWRLEFSIWLHTLAWSMISIFISIFMLRYGYSLEAVLIYNIIMFGADVPLNFLARALIFKWGARTVTAIGIIAAAAFVICFHYLATVTWPALIALAIILAIYDSFYWVGHFYLFIQSSGKPEDAGRSIGIVNSVRIFAGMLGPAIGAAILIFGGQNLLLGVSAAVLILSIIPLFRLRHLHDKPARRMPLREFLSDERERHNYLSLGLFSIHGTADDPIWPIFIFMALGTLNSIAMLAVVISLSTIVLSYIAGIMSNKRAVILMSIGTVGAAALWLLRFAVDNAAFYYASVVFMGFFAILINVPIDSSIVARGRMKDPLWAATLRNAVGMATPLLFFALLLLLITVLEIGFIAAAISLLLLFGLTQWYHYRTFRYPSRR
jgi:MFS family permease